MPYIKSQDYARAVDTPRVPGELNYAITMKIVARLCGDLTCQEFTVEVTTLVTQYLARVGMNYTNGNAVMGVLDCASRELRRRVGPVFNPHLAVNKIERQLKQDRKWVYDVLLAPYEDEKIIQNGDVYPQEILRGM